MSKVVFISDFFLEHCIGGGELNDDELINIFTSRNYDVEKVQSHVVTKGYLERNKDSFFVVGNFVNLSVGCKELLKDCRYVIYEHDHKYLRTRNPAKYRNFIAPQRDILNFYFYKNARAVLCQSKFHKKIIESNLDIDNVVSLGGNIWSLDALEYMRSISRKEKSDICSIMNSDIPHKNTLGALKYAEKLNIEHELISDPDYRSFLSKLGQNKKLLFLPRTPETLSRIVVEARMMGCSVITNELVGATSEDWFKLKGEALIDLMIEKREDIASIVEGMLSSSNEDTSPLISVITTFHEGEKYLEHFLDNITNQTMFDKCELVLIDAASPGGEADIVKKYLKLHDNIVYKRLSDKVAITPCLNMAAKMANGKFLTFAMIDDRKKDDCLEVLYNGIVDEDVQLVYGDVLQTREDNETYENNSSDGSLFEHSTYPFSREYMVKCLPGPMPLWKNTLHDVAGFFDSDICDYADDWELWLRAVDSGCSFKKINEIVGLYKTGGRSQQNDIEQRKEEARIFFKYSHLFGQNYQIYKPYFEQFIGAQ
tara:strand:- start:207 stop:1826 length:1620 start_codon:yes stop_codon:yes gene_type:complete